jgi:hypothetical protein
MGEGIKWSPYLEKMREQMDQLKLSEIKEWSGHDLTTAKEFKTAQVQGGFKAFRAEKIEKIGIGSFYNKEIHHGFCTIIPDEDYDLPMFISQWEEGEKEIRFLVDIMPTVDSLIDEEYRKRYLESVQPLWEKYASLPGICPEESDVIRSLCSIIYTAANVPIDKEGMRLAALAPHTEYLKSYLNFLQEAYPIKDDTKRKEVKRKRGVIRNVLRTRFFGETVNDSVSKNLEGNLQEQMVTILF